MTIGIGSYAENKFPPTIGHDPKERAEYSDRAKTEFLTNMSHELRTPLHAIIGFSDMLKDKPFGPLHTKYAECADYIYDSGNHLLKIINDILDVSRIDVSEMELSETRIDVGETLLSCTQMIDERARKAQVSMSADIPDDMPGLHGDETRAKQAVLNLLANAFPPGNGKITVSAFLDDEKAIHIKVEDTGIGIDPKDIPRILIPFQQVENIITRSHEGAGLGLRWQNP